MAAQRIAAVLDGSYSGTSGTALEQAPASQHISLVWTRVMSHMFICKQHAWHIPVRMQAQFYYISKHVSTCTLTQACGA